MSDGKEAERRVARWLSDHPAWTHGPVVTARSLSGGLARGEDLARADGGRLPVSIEIKHGYGSARPHYRKIADWLEQSHGQSGGRPYVVIHGPKHVQVRMFDVYTPWDLNMPATGWWSTPLAFWVQQPIYAAGLEF